MPSSSTSPRPASVAQSLGRHSYVLVTSSFPDSPDESDYHPTNFGPRPRFFYILPILALIDCLVSITLGIAIIRHESKLGNGDNSNGGNQGQQDDRDNLPAPSHASWDKQKLASVVVGCAIMRVSVISIVAVSKRIRELGVVVAATCILSALFNVSVANLLFQARAISPPSPVPTPVTLVPSILLPDHQPNISANVSGPFVWPLACFFPYPHPTMTILISSQIAFTVLEWVIYIAIAGVKIPPGGNPVKAKRWARNLAKDPSYRNGVEARSLYVASDSESADGETSLDDNEPTGQHNSLRPQSIVFSQDVATETLGLGSPRKSYGAIPEPQTPQSVHKSSIANSSRVTVPSPRKSSIASSRRAAAPPFTGSPTTAELGLVGFRSQDGMSDQQEEDELDELDPDDIIDITSNRNVSRQESRRRLALAANPERRTSSLSIFASSNASSSSRGAISAGGGASGSGYPRSQSRQRAEGSSSGSSVGGFLSTSLDAQTTSQDAVQVNAPLQTSNSVSEIPLTESSASLSSTTPRRRGYGNKQLKLPNWLRSGKKRP